MAFDALKLIFGRAARENPARAQLSGEREETSQRLQVGFFGLGAMLLLVGLASIIMNSVKETTAGTVPEAAPTVVASEVPVPARDPLADAGVVPDLPADPDAPVAPRPGEEAVTIPVPVPSADPAPRP